MEIKIPVRTHEDFGDSLLKLILIVNQIASSKEEVVCLDFRRARMLNPFFLTGLACEIDRLKTLGKAVEYRFTEHQNISSYLDTIYFPESLAASAERLFTNLNYFANKSYIPLISFQTGSNNEQLRENILSSVSDLLKNQLNFSTEERMPLSYVLDEMVNNINDHSHALKGFVFAQYYPNSNYLDLCVCDGGRGIYRSFVDNPNFNPHDEIEAVQLALSGKSTKNEHETRGYGLRTTIKMLVKGLRGNFFLWTGKTTLLATVNKEAIGHITGGAFQGTFIAIRLPTIIPNGFRFYNFTEG